MKYLGLLLFAFIGTSCSTQPQNIGLSYPGSNSTIRNNNIYSSISTIENFKITEDLKPITVRVNVIILKKEDGTGNYNLKNPEEKKALEDFMQASNEAWTKFYQPNDLTGCYTGSDFYPDSKIRFTFNYIEIKDNYAWNYKNSGADLEKKKYGGITPYNKWYLAYMDKKIAEDPTIPKGVNIYLTMDADNYDRIYNAKGSNYDLNDIAAGQSPSTKNLTQSSSSHLPNRYLKYLSHRYAHPKEFNKSVEETMSWDVNDGRIYAHELGHVLGLNHTNEYHLANTCKYTMMSQRWTDPKNYLQPTEILKAHKFLRESNLIQFVTDDSFLGNTFSIESNTNWIRTQRFYSNLTLANNIEIRISEPIIIAPQAKITFGNNAKIIFEKNGKIIYPNGKEFTNYINKKGNSIVKN